MLDPRSDDEEQRCARWPGSWRPSTERRRRADDIRKRKKARKIDDYADLGTATTHNDPFIDNSEVHDEIVPENVTTAHGGSTSTAAARVKRGVGGRRLDMEAIISRGEREKRNTRG